MARGIFILVSFALLAGCGRVYKKWEKNAFPAYTWSKDTEIIYQPFIRDITKQYELVLGIRYIAGSDIPDIPVIVTVISPSGKEDIKNFRLQVITPGRQPLARCAGDICDLESPVGELVFTEPGDYRFVVRHDSERGTLYGVMEFGLILDEKQ